MLYCVPSLTSIISVFVVFFVFVQCSCNQAIVASVHDLNMVFISTTEALQLGKLEKWLRVARGPAY